LERKSLLLESPPDTRDLDVIFGEYEKDYLLPLVMKEIRSLTKISDPKRFWRLEKSLLLDFVRERDSL
jgi:hypothetical protein